mmetsp:Transcript_23154/g.65332  ORF Transcript_23154/g.65332 Transcript_23154/m.65332 type:complete len:429 (-) Transcript_23154:120-1406(-)
MLGVSDATLLLGRYGDLLGVLTALPLLSELKFGALLRSQEQSREALRKKAQETQETETALKEQQESSAKGKDKKKDDKAASAATDEASAQPDDGTLANDSAAADVGATIPPFWALACMLLAEVISSMQLLDPEDKQTRRAVGVVLRAQQNGKEGFSNALKTVEKILEDSDVNELLRLTAAWAGIGALLISIILGLHRQESMVIGSPMKVMKQVVVRVFKGMLLAPRLWLFTLLGAWVVLANRSVLLKIINKSAIKELVKSSVVLWRTIGTVGTAMNCPRTGPMPLWATLTLVAGMVRVAHYVTFERLSWDVVTKNIDIEGVSANVCAARCMMALEAWAFLALAPHISIRRHMILLGGLLFAPCVCIVMGGPALAPLEPYLELAGPRLSIAVAVVTLCTVFMGGFPTMMAVILLAQVLIRIHKLDTMKY